MQGKNKKKDMKKQNWIDREKNSNFVLMIKHMEKAINEQLLKTKSNSEWRIELKRPEKYFVN